MARTIRITLKDYLIRLQAEDLDKPPSKRRKVPALNELATVIGISRESMSRLVNNHRRRVNLDLFAQIANELEKHGWQPQINDLLMFTDTTEEEFTKNRAPIASK